jgi:hypothetical protein
MLPVIAVNGSGQLGYAYERLRWLFYSFVGVSVEVLFSLFASAPCPALA